MKWICPACKAENEEDSIKCCCGYVWVPGKHYESPAEPESKIANKWKAKKNPVTLYFCTTILGLLLAIVFPATVFLYLQLYLIGIAIFDPKTPAILSNFLAALFYSPLFIGIIFVLYGEGKKTLGAIGSKSIISRISEIFHTMVFLGGIYGSIWCRKHHISRGGHLVDSISPSDIYFDQIWATGLVVATVVAILFKKAYAPIFLCFTVWILIYRFYFGSGGGIFPFPL